MRWIAGVTFLVVACGDDGATVDTTIADSTSSATSTSTTDADTTDATTSSADSSSGESLSSTTVDASSSTEESGTTGEALPCSCAPTETCIELSTDACGDPHTPSTHCSETPAACEGIEPVCDTECGWEICGGPGCIGPGVDVCGTASTGFVCGSGGFSCNLFLQNCNLGEKCTSWDSNGDQAYDNTRCAPEVKNPVAVGGVCTFEGSRWSGIDDCVTGAMCLTEMPGAKTGICRAACEGNPFNASCDDPETTCVLEDDHFGWCLPS